MDSYKTSKIYSIWEFFGFFKNTKKVGEKVHWFCFNNSAQTIQGKKI